MLCVFVASAQNKNTDIHGYVKNVDNQPVGYSSVFLLRATDSSVVKLAVTTPTGNFKFTGIATGKYLIKVSYTGYRPGVTAINISNGSSSFDVGILQLIKNNTDLAEISVTGERNFVEVKPGKTTLNIQNSVLAIGNSALSILKMAPGVQIDNNDNILLNGKQDVLILIDNKPTYLSNSALADLLHGTQSIMIDKIEITTNPNSTYDAAGTGGVINIKMLHNKNVGFNAQVNAGAGIVSTATSDYNEKAKGSAGINFNYRTKKLNIFGNYSYINIPSFKSATSNRVNSYNGVINLITDDWFIDQTRVTHNFRLGADYSLSAKHVIGFLASGLFMDMAGPKYTTSTIGSINSIDTTILTNAGLKRHQSNITYNLNYRGDMGKAGDITIDANYINFDRTYNETILSNYYNHSNGVNYRNLLLQNNAPANFNVYVFIANYHININSGNSFTAGFKDSYAKTDNVSDFGSVTNGVYQILPAFNGRFKYTEMLYAGYFDFNHTISKKASLELGLRVEQTISDGLTPNITSAENVHNNYIDFFPNLQYNYIVNADNQFKFSYRRSIYRPKYEELNPFTFYYDQYTYQKGNPYLKPYYSNTLELSHVYKNKISTSLSFSAVNGFTQTIYMQNDSSRVTTLKKINLGNRYNYDLHVLAPLTFTKWYNTDFDLDFKYQQFTNTAANFDSGSPDITLTFIQHLKLPLGIKAEVTAQYETPTTFGIFRYKSNFSASGGISKSVTQKGTIQFQVDNIFQSDKNIYTSHYQNLNISGTQPNSFRAFQLSFSYALGSKTIKAARKNTGADEEQGRVGSN